MIVLDTHAWIWWINGPEVLPEKARRLIDEAVIRRDLCVSSISVWELALLVKKGRLRLTMDVSDWIAKSESLPFLHFVPVDNAIAVKSVNLPGYNNPDPADRIIIATAMMLGASLVTKDEKMLGYTRVNTVWQGDGESLGEGSAD